MNSIFSLFKNDNPTIENVVEVNQKSKFKKSAFKKESDFALESVLSPSDSSVSLRVETRTVNEYIT